MQKLLIYSEIDLVFDPVPVADALNRVCNSPTGPFVVRGLCRFGDDICFVLLPTHSETAPEQYLFVINEEASAAGFLAAVEERWEAGFDCVGNVALDGSKSLMLYAYQPGSD